MQSVERPIVIAWRHSDAALPASIAPGSALVGVFLPYTPLHHLLLAACGCPLVMTSGNRSDEPIAYRNKDALARLADIADLFLLHDREIVTRCDDSVATVIAGAPVVLRRSRGFVPRAIALPREARVPVLGTGALLKNTFCLVVGRRGVAGAAHRRPRERRDAGVVRGVDRAHAALPPRDSRDRGARPAPRLPLDALCARAHRASGRWACSTTTRTSPACSPSTGSKGPAIGVAFDGTGYGTDGTAWGGEILVATLRDFTRAATLRPIPLAGGDLAIRRPWRIALALLDEAFGGDPPLDALALFADVPASEIALVRQMIREGVNTPRARGVGRYFDAFGALALARPSITFEGQLALALNVVADPSERGRYEYDVDDRRRPCRNSTCGRPSGRPRSRSSGARRPRPSPPSSTTRSPRRRRSSCRVAARGVRTAAGGAHRRLLPERPARRSRCVQELSRSFRIVTHRRVPPGDGGIALGQAVVAASRV